MTNYSLANETSITTDDPVIVLERKLVDKRNEISAQLEHLQKQQDRLNAAIIEKNALENNAKKFEKKQALAQERLDEQFKRMLENPDIDLTQYRDDYQAAWQNVKQNKSLKSRSELYIAELKRTVENQQRQKRLLATSLENLQEAKKEARVKRLRQQLNHSDTIEVVHTVTCNESMTLASCANQGKTLAMQKAVNEFQSQLLNNVTESTTAKLNSNLISFNIHVLNSNIVDSSFSGNNRYITRLQAEMRSHPDDNASCKLLDLAERYCVDRELKIAKNATKQAKRWINIKIRSNQFDDNVSINGVTYGSTPVEIMLPAGQHKIMVEKSGYKSYTRQMFMNKDSVVWASLKERDNRPSAGKQFADKLTNNRQAPKMVVIGAGQYKIGHQAQQAILINKSYSISTTPVTVEQFAEFIAKTGYVTTAEEGQGCASIVNGETKQLLNHNWRKPGFEQTDNSPVVCITKEDAQHYSNWLSDQTGFVYSLPTEAQWEIAARAGNNTDYWWGDDIGVGNANTGWSGSTWSNKSTSPVASFPANPFGLYDTTGNVWEWTEGQIPIARGGAWNFSPSSARVAERLELESDLSANYLGFRVIRNI